MAQPGALLEQPTRPDGLSRLDRRLDELLPPHGGHGRVARGDGEKRDEARGAMAPVHQPLVRRPAGAGAAAAPAESVPAARLLFSLSSADLASAAKSAIFPEWSVCHLLRERSKGRRRDGWMQGRIGGTKLGRLVICQVCTGRKILPQIISPPLISLTARSWTGGSEPQQVREEQEDVDGEE